MGIITWTREARCKDCDHFRYYKKGRRKLHKCILHRQSATLKDKMCFEGFKMRKEYYPKRLDEDIFN